MLTIGIMIFSYLLISVGAYHGFCAMKVYTYGMWGDPVYWGTRFLAIIWPVSVPVVLLLKFIELIMPGGE